MSKKTESDEYWNMVETLKEKDAFPSDLASACGHPIMAHSHCICGLPEEGAGQRHPCSGFLMNSMPNENERELMTNKQLAVELCKAILSNPGFADKADTKTVVSYVTTLMRELEKNFPEHEVQREILEEELGVNKEQL